MKPSDMIPFDPFSDPDPEKETLKRIIVVLSVVAFALLLIVIAQNSGADCASANPWSC